MKIDWKRKLTSRKFWMGLAMVVTGIVVFIQNREKTPEAITGLVMVIGGGVAYIIGEGLADSGGVVIQNETQSSEHEEGDADDSMV